MLCVNLPLLLLPAGCWHRHGTNQERPSGGDRELQPLPRHQQHRGDQSPQIRHVAVISEQELHQPLTMHGSLPMAQIWGSSLAQDGCRASQQCVGLERRVWGWREGHGAMPILGLQPWGQGSISASLARGWCSAGRGSVAGAGWFSTD